tara:strand:- start:165 stop:308 length:144 start_codon:yes stop_codon:yes gene_type:complete
VPKVCRLAQAGFRFQDRLTTVPVYDGVHETARPSGDSPQLACLSNRV